MYTVQTITSIVGQDKICAKITFDHEGKTMHALSTVSRSSLSTLQIDEILLDPAFDAACLASIQEMIDILNEKIL